VAWETSTLQSISRSAPRGWRKESGQQPIAMLALHDAVRFGVNTG
jgi:hypothetical protein